jgi:KEOPS complex subunit Pcc1
VPDDSGSEREREHDLDRAPHELVLEFDYEDDARAALIERSVSQEIGEIEGDRTAATVAREGRTVVVDVAAADLVALRAGLNTWCSLVEVAERCSTAVPAPTSPASGDRE